MTFNTSTTTTNTNTHLADEATKIAVTDKAMKTLDKMRAAAVGAVEDGVIGQMMVLVESLQWQENGGPSNRRAEFARLGRAGRILLGQKA